MMNEPSLSNGGRMNNLKRKEWAQGSFHREGWGISRLEVDPEEFKARGNKGKQDDEPQKLSGQLNESCIREIGCLTCCFDSAALQPATEELSRALTALYGGQNRAGLPSSDFLHGENAEVPPPLVSAVPLFPPMYGFGANDDGLVEMMFEYHTHTLRSLLQFERHLLTVELPGVTDKRVALDLRRRFLFYQLLRGLAHVHSKGYAFGGALSSRDIRVNESQWLSIPPKLHPSLFTPVSAPVKPCHADEVDRPVDWGMSLTSQWVEGRISNFEYLMALNVAVGRSAMDGRLHAILPWVTDFSCEWGGWRDLSMSKNRLHNGDTMLDVTYENSTPKHHVAECLSELAYYMYEARRTPLHTLRSTVRSNFVAAQYPVSMQRLYSWTLDECIPAFYNDPGILRSHHTGLGLKDLQVPEWCQGDDPSSAFIAYHRAMLESDEVSANIHRWIDLVFGASLIGERARRNKNVPFAPVADASTLPYKLEFFPRLLPLFRTPHPQRAVSASRRASSLTPEPWGDRLAAHLDASAVRLTGQEQVKEDLAAVTNANSAAEYQAWMDHEVGSFRGRTRSDAQNPMGLAMGMTGDSLYWDVQRVENWILDCVTKEEVLREDDKVIKKDSVLRAPNSEATRKEPSFTLNSRKKASQASEPTPQERASVFTEEDGILLKFAPQIYLPTEFEEIGGESVAGAAGGSRHPTASMHDLRISEFYTDNPMRSSTVDRTAEPRMPVNNCLRELKDMETLQSFCANYGAAADDMFHLPPELAGVHSPAAPSLRTLIAADAYAAGLILGELYLHHCPANRVDRDPRTRLASVLKAQPPAVQVAVAWLLDPNPEKRVTIDYLLQRNCTADKTKRGGGRSRHSMEAREQQQAGSAVGPCRPTPSPLSEARSFDESAIDELFPEYFSELYDYLEALHRTESEATASGMLPDEIVRNETQAQSALQALIWTLQCAPSLVELPAEGFGLALPHILRTIFGSTVPYVYSYEDLRRFRKTGHEDEAPHPIQHVSSSLADITKRSRLARQPSERFGMDSQSLVLHLPRLVALIGSKLSCRQNQSILFPRIAAFLDSISHPAVLLPLLVPSEHSRSPMMMMASHSGDEESSLWPVLIRLGGWAAFVHHFLAVLLKWLDGRKMLTKSQESTVETNAMIWTDDEVALLARKVPPAAEIVLTSLPEERSLGNAVCMRHVFPALLSKVGRVEPSASKTISADFHGIAWRRRGVSQTLSSLCKCLGPMAMDASMLVMEHLLHPQTGIVPKFEAFIDANPSDEMYGAVYEVIVCLDEMMDSLDPQLVLEFYIRRKANICSLLMMLLPSSKQRVAELVHQERMRVTEPASGVRKSDSLDDDRSSSSDRRGRKRSGADAAVPASSRADMFLLCEASRLVAQVCMKIGKEDTVECVLPLVERFFGIFVHYYGDFLTGENIATLSEVSAALEVTRELYLPIAAMVHFNVMQDNVPSANKILNHIRGTDHNEPETPKKNWAMAGEGTLGGAPSGGRVNRKDQGEDTEGILGRGLAWFKETKKKVDKRLERGAKLLTQQGDGLNAEGFASLSEIGGRFLDDLSQPQRSSLAESWFVRETIVDRGVCGLPPAFGDDVMGVSLDARERSLSSRELIAGAKRDQARESESAHVAFALSADRAKDSEENPFLSLSDEEESEARGGRVTIGGVSDRSSDCEEEDEAAGGDDEGGDAGPVEQRELLKQQSSSGVSELADSPRQERPKQLRPAVEDESEVPRLVDGELLPSEELTAHTMELQGLPDRRAELPTPSPAQPARQVATSPGSQEEEEEEFVDAMDDDDAAALSSTASTRSTRGQLLAEGRSQVKKLVKSIRKAKFSMRQQPSASFSSQVSTLNAVVSMSQPEVDFSRAGHIVPTPWSPKCAVHATIDTTALLKSHAKASATPSAASNATAGGGTGSQPPPNAHQSLPQAGKRLPLDLHDDYPMHHQQQQQQQQALCDLGGQASADRGIRVMATDMNESVLLSGHRGGAILTWPLRSLPELKPTAAYRAHTDGIVAASLLPDAKQAASCDQDGALHVWDIERGATLEVWRDGISQAANQRQNFTPAHRSEDVLPYVALANTSERIKVWQKRGGWGKRPLTGGLPFPSMDANTFNDFDDYDATEFEDFEVVANQLSDGGAGWVGSSLWRSDKCVIAATPNQVHTFDLRTPTSTHERLKVQLVPCSEWGLTRSPLLDPADTNYFKGSGIRCVATGSSDSFSDPYVYAGVGSGKLFQLDQRTGQVVHGFQAHDLSILHVTPLGRHKILTVSADCTALLWDLSGKPVGCKQVAVRGLPSSQGGMAPTTICSHQVIEQDRNQVRHEHVVYAASGHKVAATRVPRWGSTEALAPRHFTDVHGFKIHRHQLNIQSMAVLSFWNMILLGCSDDKIRIAV